MYVFQMTESLRDEPERFRLFNRGYYWGTCRVSLASCSTSYSTFIVSLHCTGTVYRYRYRHSAGKLVYVVPVPYIVTGAFAGKLVYVLPVPVPYLVTGASAGKLGYVVPVP